MPINCVTPAWVLSVPLSFFVNCCYTFRVRPTLGRLLRFPLSSVVNIGLTTLGTIFLVEVWGFDERLAPLVMGILAVPATFLVARLALLGRQPSRQESAEAP
ncbi:MAG: GtrA family protein [Ornithinimicrobium sp.]